MLLFSFINELANFANILVFNLLVVNITYILAFCLAVLFCISWVFSSLWHHGMVDEWNVQF